ncbi:hypothetical protein GWK08_04830 [Leptobacterium flavescens]|uniref:RHS repeat protein n=1 Tax=Leptobacterium flavescens TaxID=472055 RepID=A0A6P0UHN7_9FLAO|nr:RHS repeat domain-containing protein [Leptobacterium flavescens]NER12754.1 hypothetical protein [Leptobacterium flavescens]
MKRPYWLLAFFCSLMGMGVYAQGSDVALPEIIPPSPTVASLMQFEEVPVDYYSGQANISIPLYSRPLSGGLGLSFGLSYHTTGVRINERSGWTGTGWSLTGLGVISRTVRGVVDEEANGPGIRTGVLHNDDFWNYANLTTAEKDEFNWKANGSSSDKYDTQLDLYQFSLLNISGRFVIIKENGALVPKLLSRAQQVKIELDYDPVTLAVNSFTITDTAGYKYIFDEIENVESIPVTGSVPQGGTGSIPASPGALINNRSAWHLSMITTSNGEELVSFDYTPIQELYTASITRTYNDIISPVTAEFMANAYNTSILKPEQTVSYYTTNTDTRKLSKITFRDGVTIDFVTDNTHPETGGAILKDIIIKDEQGQEDKRYTLSYSTIATRLWLDEVSEKAGSLSYDHTLSYTNRSQLPAFDSESDVWGYTDGYTSNSNSCLDNLTFDKDAIKTGLLNKITYPTGGSKEFVFEHNTFSFQGSQALSSDVYMANPDNYTPTTLSLTLSGSNNNPPPTPTAVTIGYNQDVYVNTSLQSGTQADADRFRVVLTASNGDEYWATLSESCIKFSVPAGSYTFGLKLIDGLTLDPYSATTLAKLHYGVANSSPKEYLLGGGVRIKEVIFRDDENPTAIQKKVSYSYTEANDTNKSSGSIDGRIGNLTKSYQITETRYLFSTSDNRETTFSPTNVTYQVISKEPNTQLTRGSYVGYKTVSMFEDNLGKSVFTFTSARDFASPPETFTYPYRPAPNLEFKRGLLLNQKVYDNSDRVLSEVVNEYNLPSEVTIASSFNVEPINCAWTQFYDQYFHYINTLPQNAPNCGGGSVNTDCIAAGNYQNCGPAFFTFTDNVTSGWSPLTQAINKSYFYDVQGTQSVVEQRQTFEYNQINYQQKVVNTYLDENGTSTHRKTELFYPVESYPTSEYTQDEQTVITKMVTLNQISSPIYTKNYEDGVLLSSLQNVYKEYHTDMIKMKEVKTKKANEAVERRINYVHYDTNCNPVELSQEDGAPITYLWGYNQTYPVAKIDNATLAEVATALSTTTSSLLENGITNLSSLNNLRTALPNAFVSTYEYDLLAGVTTMTDPRGYTTTYQYDEYNRLQAIRDADNRLLSDYQYHYKN